MAGSDKTPMFRSTYIEPMVVPQVRRRSHRLAKAIAKAAFLMVSGAHGATIVVDDDSDLSTVNCTLRDALESANSDTAVAGCDAGFGTDTIVFDPSLSPATIVLQGSPLVVSSSLSIRGTGAEEITISASNQSQVLRVDDGSSSTTRDVSVSGVTLADGNGADGGAVWSNESLRILRSVISGSSAQRGGGVFSERDLVLEDVTLSGNQANVGGAIFNNYGDLTLTRSTIMANSASGQGGGLFNYGNGTLENATISANSAGTAGGGVVNYIYSELDVRFSTITGNTASLGAGVYNTGFDSEYRGTLRIANTIVANSQGQDCLNQPAGLVPVNTNNLIEDGSCADTATGLMTGDPGLGSAMGLPIGTFVHPLQSMSIAIDALDAAACTGLDEDQAESMRPVDGNSDGDTRCDVGAFEFIDVYGPVVTSTTADDVTAPGVTTYTVAIDLQDDGPIDELSIQPGDVMIAGVAGTLVSTSADSSLLGTRATFEFEAPGGRWTAQHNGTYVVTLVDGAIADQAVTGSNASLEQTLGTFEVALPPNAAPTVDAASFVLSSSAHPMAYVGTVTASDVDGNLAPTGTFAITSGNDAGAFAIDDAGVLSVVDPTVAGDQDIDLEVEASDTEGLRGSATISVQRVLAIFGNGFE